MAEIIAEDDEVLEANQPETTPEISDASNPLEPVEQSNDVEVDETEQPEEIPEKYAGKSLKDVIAMHQNAESAMGRQSQEVGELRRTVDDFILSQSRKNQETDEEPETDFFTDPKAVIKQTLEADPVRQEMQKEIAENRQERAVKALTDKHPNIKQVFNDPKFGSWVQKKPHRLTLLSKTDQYDLDAADELLDLWEDYTGAQQQAGEDTVKFVKQERSAAVQKANTGNVTTASKPAGRGPVYRRADIIKLKMTDPDRYEALEDEIMAAYAEKRVV